jgi:phospholipid-translocating ATPase
LTEDFYQKWLVKYNNAKADLVDREKLVSECILELETDMELLGVTGVEDKLQDNVASVI